MIKILKNSLDSAGNGKYNLDFSNLTLLSGNKIILENENLSINFSRMVIIKGTVGAGKSTILKMLGGIIENKSGSHIIKDFNNNVINSVYIHSQPELNFITGYINDELKLAGIEDFAPFEKYLNKTVYELSGGALKKLSLLMAVNYCNGRIILADEPLDMLDDKEAESLAKLIIDYSNTTPFIIATHDKHFDDTADVIIEL